jgi:hypothetical protein
MTLIRKGNPVHVTPAWAGSDHFGSYIHNLSNRLFSGLEPMTSWSEGKF